MPTRRVMILRHAKAVAKSADDFGRVLAPRGRDDMTAIAGYLAEHRLVPALALVSPAARTRETWSLTGLRDVATRFVDEIYDAEMGDLLACLRSIEDGIESVVLVGHNPGLEELADALLPSPSPVAAGLPTAALVVIDLPAASWRDLKPGTGRLVRMTTPAALLGREPRRPR